MPKVQAVYVGHDALEPTIAVDRQGRAFMAAAGFDQAAGLLGRTDIMRSTDGGLKWQVVTPGLPPAASTPPLTLDPYIYIDEATGRVFSIDLYVGCSYLNVSDNGGQSWTANPFACGDLVNDHQTLVTGPPPPNLQTTGYPNVVYYCVNRVLEVSCARSLDGGRNFQDAPGQAYQGNDPAAGGLCGGLHGHAITDSKGRLFIPKGHCRFPWIAVSEDGGNTWSRVQVSDKVPSTCALNCGIQTSLAADDEDNLYYIWWDRLPACKK